MVMAVTRKFVAGDVMEVWVLFKVCDWRCDGNMATLPFVGGNAMDVWLLWELLE
jgi:hypothetical protein